MVIINKVKNWLDGKEWIVIVILLILLLTIAGVYAYDKLTTHTTTIQSQTTAETVAGVNDAADRAKVKLTQEQSKVVANEIKRIREDNVKPNYVTKTVVREVEKTVEVERKRNDADFSMVTDPNNPDKKVDLSKMDGDTKVELNQYNIKAYKPVIRTVEYTPSTKEVGISVQKKITKSGVYAGAGVTHDMDDGKTAVKYMVSW